MYREAPPERSPPGRRAPAGARRSYAWPYPKSRKQRVVRIPEELMPFLEHAIANFPGPWLFPDPDGRMRTVKWQPEDILRRALKRAGS